MPLLSGSSVNPNGNLSVEYPEKEVGRERPEYCGACWYEHLRDYSPGSELGLWWAESHPGTEATEAQELEDSASLSPCLI